MLAESGGVARCECGGEAMENGVVSVENSRGVSEFSGVPVVVCRENGGLRLRVNAYDVGFVGLINGGEGEEREE